MRSPQFGQRQPEIPNTRCNKSAQGVQRDRPRARRSGRDRRITPSSPLGSRLGPRALATTRLRRRAFAASTPWYTTVFVRGAGTSDANRATSSDGENTKPVVPSDQARLSSRTTIPSGRRFNRDLASAGRLMYLANRSRASRAWDPTDVFACRLYPETVAHRGGSLTSRPRQPVCPGRPPPIPGSCR